MERAESFQSPQKIGVWVTAIRGYGMVPVKNYRLVWATLKTDASSAILDLLKKNRIVLQQNHPVILEPVES
jgi:hypothetical protein